MRDLDRDGRILCELQGKIFEKSASGYDTSSAVFIRRYMQSGYAARMDRPGFMDRITDEIEAFESLDEEYGISKYGSERYSQDELFWIGYIYRCWAYVYEIPSRAVYKICSVTEMHKLYYAYHTLDPLAAIQRILEAKHYPVSEEELIALGVEILRRIRAQAAGQNMH